MSHHHDDEWNVEKIIHHPKEKEITEEMKWQAIETIPKTGEEVLTRNGNQGGVYELV